ncbi:hypothetical protein C7B79_32655, partial [Chroococcidiopsis cubana CCALA 043]
MTKFLWIALGLCPVTLVGTTLFLTVRTQAAEAPASEIVINPSEQKITQQKIAQLSQSNSTLQPVAQQLDETSFDEINQNSQTTDALAQVTSVSQLSDVQPTDWAFQALQSLVERYGCIAGYPDGTYRGNRALTRYEFAAGLNACLDRVNELIATATADNVTKEDLATLQRLQEEFSAELATLRGRVDALEARTSELEANQFSTTTTLTGEVIAVVADVFGDERAVRSGEAEGSRGDLDINT